VNKAYGVFCRDDLVDSGSSGGSEMRAWHDYYPLW
jgi:hypothetical protein